MLKKLFYGSILFLLSTPMGYPRFYIGVQFQKSFVRNTINMGESKYWNSCIKEAYANDLLNIYKKYSSVAPNDPNQFSKTVFLFGTPDNFFNVLLQNATSLIYDKKNDASQGAIAIGAFLFRKENFLVAAEFSLGRSFAKTKEQLKLNLFKGDVPLEMQNTPLNEDGIIPLSDRFSVVKTLTQSVFFGGSIDLEEDLSLQNYLAAEVNFRFGQIIKDRIYLFAIFGVDWNQIYFYIKDKNIVTETVNMYCCIDQWIGTESKWRFDSLSPNPEFNTMLLTFDKTKANIGVTCGVGAEFFISRKISCRTQCVYSYFPGVRVPSQDGLASIKYFSKGFKINCGLFWRF
jgi:hypothetical protein